MEDSFNITPDMYKPDLVDGLYRTFAQWETIREEKKDFSGGAAEEFESVWSKVEAIYEALSSPRNQNYRKWRQQLDESLGFPNDYYFDTDLTPENYRLKIFREGLRTTFKGEYRMRKYHPDLFLVKNANGEVIMDDRADLTDPKVIFKIIQAYTAEFTAILQYCYELGHEKEGTGNRNEMEKKILIRPEHALKIAQLCYHNSRDDVRRLYEEYIDGPFDSMRKEIPYFALVAVLRHNRIHPEKRLQEIRDFVDNFDVSIMGSPSDFDYNTVGSITPALLTAAALYYAPYKEGYLAKRAAFIKEALIQGVKIKSIAKKNFGYPGYPVDSLDASTWQLLGMFSVPQGLELIEKIFQEDPRYGDPNYLLSEKEKRFGAASPEIYGNNPAIEGIVEDLLRGGLVIDKNGNVPQESAEILIDRLEDSNPAAAKAIKELGFAMIGNYCIVAPELYTRLRELSGKPSEEDLSSNDIRAALILIQNALLEKGFNVAPRLIDRINIFITKAIRPSPEGQKPSPQAVLSSALWAKLREIEKKHRNRNEFSPL